MSSKSSGFHDLIGRYSTAVSEEYSSPSYEVSKNGAVFFFPENSDGLFRSSYIDRVAPLVRELLEMERSEGLPKLSGLIQDYIHYDDVLGRILIHRNPKCKKLVASFPGKKSIRLSMPPVFPFLSGVDIIEKNRAKLLDAMKRAGLEPDFSYQPASQTKAGRNSKSDPKAMDGKSVYNDEVIGEVTVLVKKGTRSITLKIERSGEVVLSIPSKSRLNAGIEFIKAKRSWIEKTRNRINSKKALLTPEILSDRKKLNGIYRDSIPVLTQRAAQIATLLGTVPSSVKVGSYTAKWGKCSTKGEITLNFVTAQLPDILRDSIIIHEMTHLRHMNHSDGFHNLLEQYLGVYLNHELKRYREEFPQDTKPSDDNVQLIKEWNGYTYLIGILKKVERSRSVRPLQKVINDELKKYSIR